MKKKEIVIWADGGARGNPGHAAIGVVVKAGDRTLYETNRYIGTATNNQAEYQAIITALEWLRSQKITSDKAQIVCYLDSELVAHQLNGQYRVKHQNMKPLFDEVQNLLDDIGEIRFSVVPRSQNKRADQLVNECLDRESDK